MFACSPRSLRMLPAGPVVGQLAHVALHGLPEGLVRQLGALQLGLALQRPLCGLLPGREALRVPLPFGVDLNAEAVGGGSDARHAGHRMGKFWGVEPCDPGQARKEKTPGTLTGRAFRSESGQSRGGRMGGAGAGNRNRTYDLRITNAPLYQLSYSGGAANFRGWDGGGSMRGYSGRGGKPPGSRGDSLGQPDRRQFFSRTTGR